MTNKIESKYGSHLPVLELIFSCANINDVFEYGCGIYSTKFFIDRASFVISVEMQNSRRYDKIKKELVSEKLSLHCMLGDKDAISYFNSTNKKYDLVFVDGIARENCTVNAFGRTDIIVVHDLGRRAMKQGWDKLNVPKNYGVIIMGLASPSTTVYTSNKVLFNELRKYNSIVIKTAN